MPSTHCAAADNDPGLSDLGPLAWVLDELRRCLDGANKAAHRFVRDAEMAPGPNASERDTSPLRVARQQLHQAAGALEMVGLPAPARLLYGMESAVQQWVQHPDLCSEDAATRIERASVALTEYLEGRLKGKSASSVALFPQYRAVMELVAAERIHPADLWPPEWHWMPVLLNAGVPALPYVPEVRAHLDQAVLRIVKSANVQAAAKLARVCAGLAGAQSTLEPRSFWAIANGFFEALALSLLPVDIYTKRTASRILQQYAALAKGESAPSARLAQDLVFFCAQACPASDAAAPALRAVREAYGLSDSSAVDYETAQFGRFDPAQLALARKRIAAAAETWSALAGGDIQRIGLAGEQFAAVADSVLKLHPQNGVLAQALTGVVDACQRSGAVPPPAWAMEVATSILYLEAAYDDLDPTDDQMVQRGTRLAQRLERVRAGAEPQPLEDWMEALYRRVSDRQTMGSVVDELRNSLGEVEAALDPFFRNPADKACLRDVPTRLAQMRGVFSVLGLEQPALATVRMRASVDQFLIDAVDVAAARGGIFERLGNSLGALGLLIDMLSYQRAMAQKLFIYDEEAGEFRPLMGRQRSSAPAAAMAVAVATPVLPAPAVEAADADVGEDDPQALQDIFLEEALNVVAEGLQAVHQLASESSSLAGQTTLRRAFHTLKGSARMVGLGDFGEAAWSFEQLLSAWLAEQRPASDALISLVSGALTAFGHWAEDMARHKAAHWSAQPFCACADALRLEGKYLPLPGGQEPVVPAPAAVLPQADEQTKVIGDLRLSIPFYNVFLNEADEWSRRLITELSEWALELHRPVAGSSIALAHSLGGASATVGVVALSQMARALEQALAHVKLHGQGEARHAQVFNAAAEDIRRLLHQFAAGFLKAGDAQVLQDLQDILATEFPAPAVEAAAMPDGGHAREHGRAAADHLDADLFPIFQEEAQELMPALGTALRQWVARPENGGARSEVLRVLHTLKGSARLAGAMRLGEMAHAMESAMEALGSAGFGSAQLEPLLAQLDALQDTLAALTLAPVEDIGQAPVAPDASPEPVKRPEPRTVSGPTVRVRALLLDRLLNQAGEVMISGARLDSRLAQMRSGLGELTANLERLRQQLRDVEVQSESQMQSRLAPAQEEGQTFDPLQFDRFTRVQELTRMMAESVHDVATVQRNLQRAVEGAEDDLIAQGRQARELQRDLLRTRMVEFESLAERLYGVVRQAAKECAKQVKLDIVGGVIEMDRSVLDGMTPAFEHILRNAVAHGIEDADVRTAAGKPPVGSITITVHQESNDVSVSFSDDGGGLPLDKIRAKAVAGGLMAADAVLTDEAAARLLFAPGFSTAAEVTELSGRGIGLDVVLTALNALGGHAKTRTQAGQGSTFELVLPLTTAVTQVMMLRMGELCIGVPSHLVETVLRAPLAAAESAYARGAFAVAGEDIPFFWGGALLQVSGRSQEAQTRNLPVAVFRSAGQRLALQVDEVLGKREVVVKNLGPQLAQLPGLAGMSVLASGAVVLIYNPVALATVYGPTAKALTLATEAARSIGGTPLAQAGAASALAPLVLVVDDSITVRRVTQRLLKREGFRVALANDGLQALEVMAQEKPAVVLADIEMPRMDGFELVRNIRGAAALHDLPVIMITSRIAEKHREHAIELGVDHYLGKPYSEDELLALIRSYCAVAEESAPG